MCNISTDRVGCQLTFTNNVSATGNQNRRLGLADNADPEEGAGGSCGGRPTPAGVIRREAPDRASQQERLSSEDEMRPAAWITRSRDPGRSLHRKRPEFRSGNPG